jgi:hypothetical protein
LEVWFPSLPRKAQESQLYATMAAPLSRRLGNQYPVIGLDSRVGARGQSGDLPTNGANCRYSARHGCLKRGAA